MRTTALRKLVAASLGMSALLATLTAQTPATTKQLKPADVVTPAPERKDTEPLQLDKVEVTGSRIRTLVGEQTALLVFTLDQVQLEQRGVTRLADIRWAIPQLGGTVGFNDNLVNGGTSRAQTVSTSFNLRGLGGNSTLV